MCSKRPKAHRSSSDTTAPRSAWGVPLRGHADPLSTRGGHPGSGLLSASGSCLVGELVTDGGLWAQQGLCSGFQWLLDMEKDWKTGLLWICF